MIAKFNEVRQQLGEITALGLEILVVADVMETLLMDVEDFTFQNLGKIGAIALFRTVLAYALSREVKEIEEKQHKEHDHTQLAKTF